MSRLRGWRVIHDGRFWGGILALLTWGTTPSRSLSWRLPERSPQRTHELLFPTGEAARQVAGNNARAIAGRRSAESTAG